MVNTHIESLLAVRSVLVEHRRQVATSGPALEGQDSALNELARAQERIEMIDRALADEALLSEADVKARRIMSVTSRGPAA